MKFGVCLPFYFFLFVWMVVVWCQTMLSMLAAIDKP
ncbi:hypothetical protein T4D_4318 [Trichinella pseudospiralis]|uniref:Uncharacterized protein n=1 Tax=Trichinella pseudospiralis TaxID=6337 RepID=A0A0V1DRW4_TRIPS|nr:hypothetical protein T4D_3633 [Trichinella pseudospiralis]KRY64311.1 hypothetical protein T4D_4318 [Trichinella pseudospiralis]